MDILAPAKINLFLHVTGKRNDGYHELDSLIAFADFGDILSIKPAYDLSFSTSGEFSDKFNNVELSTCRDSGNIIIQTLWAIADIAQHTPNFDIHLTKNLPIAAGIGGGSSNAAAMAKHLIFHWNLDDKRQVIDEALLKLGADIPVCMNNGPAHVTGIGENVSNFSSLPHCPIILINPLKSCSTADIFQSYTPDYHEMVDMPDHFKDQNALIAFLNDQKNDLQKHAIECIPDIQTILNALGDIKMCKFKRMSGSGATCFGLFETVEDAQNAAQIIKDQHLEWWVQAGVLKN